MRYEYQYIWQSHDGTRWNMDLDKEALLMIQAKLKEICITGGQPKLMQEASKAYLMIEEALKKEEPDPATTADLETMEKELFGA